MIIWRKLYRAFGEFVLAAPAMLWQKIRRSLMVLALTVFVVLLEVPWVNSYLTRQLEKWLKEEGVDPLLTPTFLAIASGRERK